MENGDRFPPIKLKYDGENYWLTDGFYTTEAAWSIGQTEIEASISLGTLRDAILDSVAVNANHGLRRSNADKRRAVMTLLEDEEWQQWSNRQIAKQCKVSHTMVNKLREELTGYLASGNPENDKKIITLDVESDNPKTYKEEYKDDCPKGSGFANRPTPLINNFKVGQIVKITSNSDRSDKRLVGLKNSLALVTAINSSSVDLKLFGQTLTAVSPSDIQPVDQFFEPTICISLNQNDFRTLISNFNSIRGNALKSQKLSRERV